MQIYYERICGHDIDIMLVIQGSYLWHNANQYMHIKAQHIRPFYVNIIVYIVMYI